MKRVTALLLALLFLLSSCALQKQMFQIVYLDVFDTVTVLRGYEYTEAAFIRKAEEVHAYLQEYHRLFDIYHDCSGGIKEVNDQAGLSPVAVDRRVMALLSDGLEYCNLTGGNVNIAMGSILSLWHEAREAGLEDPENARLPDAAALDEASKHISIDTVILDREAGTVYLADPAQSLDVGAIAKGWAAQRISQTLPEGYLLNVGGNTCARGCKPDGSKWVVGVQSPEDEDSFVCTVSIADLCAVTSGDYQRSYTVNGKSYHHIIDPATRMPSEYWRSVTVLCPDSGLADCLSTALFLLPLEEGRALAAQCGADALWINEDGEHWQTDGFRNCSKWN